MELKIHI